MVQTNVNVAGYEATINGVRAASRAVDDGGCAVCVLVCVNEDLVVSCCAPAPILVHDKGFIERCVTNTESDTESCV